jgi:hypothetical protein
MTPKETQEMEKLKVQVRWLNEQLEGHEDNFGRQFDKIENLKNLLTLAKSEIEQQILEKSVEQAKMAALASYVANTETSPLSKLLRAPNHQELKVLSAITAYKAATYEMFFNELKSLLAIGDDDEDVRLQLYDEMVTLVNKLDEDIGRHTKKLSEQV